MGKKKKKRREEIYFLLTAFPKLPFKIQHEVAAMEAAPQMCI